MSLFRWFILGTEGEVCVGAGRLPSLGVVLSFAFWSSPHRARLREPSSPPLGGEEMLLRSGYLVAMKSISTTAPRARAETATVERAGGMVSSK